MDLGQKTEALMRQRSWTVSELARRVSAAGPTRVQHQHISALIRTRGRRVAWISQIAAAFGLTVEQLEAWNGEELPAVSTPATASAQSPVAASRERDYVHIAVLAAGGDRNRGQAVNGMDIAEWWATQNLPRPFDRVRLMTCRGDAFRGEIDDGDLVFVDTQRAAFDGPGIYVLLIGGQPQPRKLHQRMGGDLVVACANAAYEQEVVPPAEVGSIPIAGRVVLSLGVRRW
jgi:phage repressor protein C with HTH and peptisase S24 domain